MLIDSVARGNQNYIDLSVTDLDKDGSNEVLVSSRYINMYIAPQRGGSIFELDYKPKKMNILDSFSFTERLFPLEDNPAELFKQDEVPGQDPWKCSPTRTKNEISVRLTKDADFKGVPVRITKTISAFSGQSIVNIYYEIANLTDQEVSFNFGFDLNLSVNDGSAEEKVFADKQIKIFDAKNDVSVSLDLSDPAGIVQRKKSGGTGIFIFPCWKIKLGPKGVSSSTVGLVIE